MKVLTEVVALIINFGNTSRLAAPMITGELDEGAAAAVSPKVAKKASVKSVAGTPELKHGDKGSAVHKQHTLH